MRIIYFFFILFIFACSPIKKEYVCGNRPCVDKKDFDEYFSKNLTMEVKNSEQKKNQIPDLVKLNTETPISKQKNKDSIKEDEKIRKKNDDEKLKIEKQKLLDQRKANEKEEKIKENEKKLITKKSKSNEKENKIINNKIKNKSQDRSDTNTKDNANKEKAKIVVDKKSTIDSAKYENIKNKCDEIKDCDIDTIAEILIKSGKDKPFPKITSN